MLYLDRDYRYHPETRTLRSPTNVLPSSEAFTMVSIVTPEIFTVPGTIPITLSVCLLYVLRVVSR